jgi:hypothetical protein
MYSHTRVVYDVTVSDYGVPFPTLNTTTPKPIVYLYVSSNIAVPDFNIAVSTPDATSTPLG